LAKPNSMLEHSHVGWGNPSSQQMNILVWVILSLPLSRVGFQRKYCDLSLPLLKQYIATNLTKLSSLSLSLSLSLISTAKRRLKN